MTFQTPTVSARQMRPAPAYRAIRVQRAKKPGADRDASCALIETQHLPLAGLGCQQLAHPGECF